MTKILSRYRQTLCNGLLVLALLSMIAAPSSVRGDALPVGSDGMLVLDCQHPRLYTTLSYALKNQSQRIDIAAPQRFVIENDGKIVPLGKGETDWPAYIESLHRRGVKVLPIVRRMKDGPRGNRPLGHPAAMNRAARNIAALIQEHQFDGVILDLEHLTASEREPLTRFTSDLYEWTQAHDRLLMVCAGARAWNDQFDYVALSRNSDALLVMFYDYTGGWIDGEPAGPTAPMTTWPTSPHSIPGDLDALIEMGVPANKIVMGIPEYGYDFTLDGKGLVKSAKPYWVNQLLEIARQHDAQVRWSDQKQAPYFDYTDDAQGARHQVWLESARTFRAKLDLARSRGLAGIFTWASYWSDKAPAKSFWPTVSQWLSEDARRP